MPKTADGWVLDDNFNFMYPRADEDEKGGPGSGHFRHPGRPGEVGGSKPTGRAPEERGLEGEEEQEPEVSVGITSARPGKPPEQVKRELGGFFRRMRDAGIKRLKVIMGRGAWKGGWEPTWVTTYDGNGKARGIIIETAKLYEQDAVLFMYRAEQGADTSPRTTFDFQGLLGDREINRVEEELVERGQGGWTWYNTKKGSRLMVALVPQWDRGSSADHIAKMDSMATELRQSGYTFSAKRGWVRTEVIEKADYDRVLAGG